MPTSLYQECPKSGDEVAAVAPTDPVEILLKLASDGEIDPWDVNIIEATDAFLAELDRIDPRALARSARCLFFAAALVHLKARILNEGASEQDIIDELGDDDFFDDEDMRPRRIERPLFYPRDDVRLVPRERRPRGRSLNLHDLIEALRRLDAQSLAAAPDELDELDPWEVPFDEDIPDVPTAHEDDLEGDIIAVREALRERFAAEAAEPVPLDELVTERMNRGLVYRALLFLSNRGEVSLEQEEIYGALTVSEGPDPLHELTDDEIAKQETREERRELVEESRKKKRGIPRPGQSRGRRLNRRPGLAPPPGARRPKARRRGHSSRRSETPHSGLKESPPPTEE